MENNESKGRLRRQDDLAMGKLLGEFQEFKEDTKIFREEIKKDINSRHAELEGKIEKLNQFVEEFRTPSKAIMWAVRAVLVAAAGAFVKAIFDFMKVHIHWG